MRPLRVADGLTRYRQRYADLVSAVEATRVISLVAAEMLKRFPSSLPAKSRKYLSAAMRQTAHALERAAHHALTSSDTPPKASGEHRIEVKTKGSLAGAALRLMMAQFLSGKDMTDVDFPYRLRAQELVMLLAHFDAFMSDTLRTICVREPNALKRAKLISWEAVIRQGSWEALVTHLIEENAFSFGWHSAREKLQTLDKEYGLSISIDEQDLLKLEELEQIRHLVVHNNCRVSLEYVRRTRHKAIRVGSRILISSRLVDDAASAVTIVCSETFVTVAEKFFGANPKNLTGVWRRMKKVPQ